MEIIFLFFKIRMINIMEKKTPTQSYEQLNIKDYQCHRILGEGNLGVVRLVRKKGQSKYSSVKIMKKEEIIILQQVDHIINEYRISSLTNHPFIVKFQGFSQTSRDLYLFMEYVPGGELFTHLKEQGSFQAQKSAFYAAQVVSIFEYLHKKNIAYRDLKPQNIMIGVDGYIKLIDFGFAKIIQNRTFTLCGTPEYIAPEVLQGVGYGKAVDWWALGVLIYEMVAGIDPFSDADPLIIYQNILRGKLYFPKDFDQGARSLVKHLLTSDLSKRYGNLKDGVEDIKNHRYFNSINFNNLITKKIHPPFRPVVKSPHDTTNFQKYPEIQRKGADIQPIEDPFLNWEI